MDEPLAPTARERIDPLCRSISGTYHLDEGVQRELAARMEDTFRGYVSGGKKVSEEDAFALVQEHFGDPGLIRGLLQEAHAIEAQVSFLRKLGAIAAASLGASIVGTLLYAATTSFLSSILSRQFFFGLPGVVRTFLFFVLPEGVQSWIPALLMLGVLLYWRTRLAAGDRLWFHTISKGYFQGLILSLYAAVQILGFFGYSEPFVIRALFHEYGAPVRHNHLGEIFFFSALALSGIIQCVIWLWWLDRRHLRLKMVFVGVLAWMGYALAYTVLAASAVHTGSQMIEVARFFQARFGCITYLWDTLAVLDIAVISFLLYSSAVSRIGERKTIPVEVRW